MRRGLSREAFDRLYREHAAGLLGFLVYQTGDRALAEDVVADTFERALSARGGWRGRASEKTWLYAIAMNRVRDLARRSGAESRAMERVAAGRLGDEGNDDHFDNVADRDLLQRGLQRLSEEERAVLALRFGGDLSLSEIADLLEERQTTIEGRLYRALRRLRAESG